jgi:hypothetical protein
MPDPILITIEKGREHPTGQRRRITLPLGVCKHPVVDYQPEGEGLVNVLCLGCGHHWRVAVEPHG